MTTKTYRSTIQCGVPTEKNGLIISRALMETAIEEYMKSGISLGMLEAVSDRDNCELIMDQASHIVKNLYIDDDDYLVVVVAFFDTSIGTLANMTSDMYRISPVMMAFTGWEEGNKVVESLAFRHFNIAPVEEHIELQVA